MSELVNPKRARWLALVSAAAVLTAGPAIAQTVKIGTLNGMTGGLAAYAPPIIDGQQLVVDHVNAQGGILDGKKLELVLGDTQSNPAGAVDAAQKLISVDGVVGIIGALASSATIASATSVSVPAGVPQISPASTSPAITGLDDKDLLFRTTVSDAYQGIVLANVVKGRGMNKVAMTFINNDYGKGLAEAFRAAYTKAGGTITGDAPHEENKASYRAELATLANGGPEALVTIAYPDSGGKIILRQSLENGFFNKFIFTDGMRQGEVVSEIGAANLKGSFGTAPEAPSETTAAKRFEEAYSAAYETTKDKFFIREAYDAAMLLALAVEKAGSTDRTKVRDALRQVCCAPGETIEPGQWAEAKKLLAAGKDVNYVGASGDHEFDAMGDVAGSIGHWEIQANGDIKVLEIHGQ